MKEMTYDEAIERLRKQEEKTLKHKPKIGEHYWLDMMIPTELIPDLTPELTDKLFGVAIIPDGCVFEKEVFITDITELQRMGYNTDTDLALIRRIYIYKGENA